MSLYLFQKIGNFQCQLALLVIDNEVFSVVLRHYWNSPFGRYFSSFLLRFFYFRALIRNIQLKSKLFNNRVKYHFRMFMFSVIYQPNL